MVDRHLFVIIGGTGDLARRKLLPSLYRLIVHDGVGDACVLLGAATTAMDDAGYRRFVADALAEAGLGREEVSDWCSERVHYQPITPDGSAYATLAKRIAAVEDDRGLPGNRAFYLALPPAVFPAAIEGLGTAGLNAAPGWTRLVIEKPFGRDLESARLLNQVIHRHFGESQVYRIDHYLGKETVRNLLVFRFANTLFETAWNRDRVASVQVTVAENLGIEGRAGFYEEAGAMRDIVQNHLAQVLTLIAMQPPIDFTSEEIRNEKTRVLRAVGPIGPADVVFGQYSAGTVDGEEVAGYCQEDGVAPDSTTETFVAMRLFIDTWRWHGVPFYIRTGKRMPRRLTQIAVTFRAPPVCLFHGVRDTCEAQPNVMVITLQPDEGFELLFDVKAPGEELRLRTLPLHFRYAEEFGPLPDAYRTLILDVIQGDQTLFVRSDEVEASWRVFDPVISRGAEVEAYPAGTWGPAAADGLLAVDGNSWLAR